jgi:peptidoglycan/xylan/chitin deacetylase (PgdA/CDA1 family)
MGDGHVPARRPRLRRPRPGRPAPILPIVPVLLALLLATAGPVAAAGTRVVSHGPRDRNVVALTIDDAFSTATVRAMLATLVRERVNATWFPVGRAVAASPALWKEVADLGFPIANHTYTHADQSKRTYEQVVADILTEAAVVKRVTGRPIVPLFRPPYGAWDADVYRAAAATGQRAVVIWDALFGDTGRGPVSQLVKNALRAKPGSIILLHANQMRSAEALEQVIHAFRAKGWGFVTLPELLGLEADAAMRVPAFTSAEVPPSPLATRPRVWGHLTAE